MADIKIYGKLKNDTSDGILAGANQIKDDTQNKFQSQINSELINKDSQATTDITANTNKINQLETSFNTEKTDTTNRFSTVNTTLTTQGQRIEQIASIAAGKTQSFVYGTIQQMLIAVQNQPSTAFHVGDILYLTDQNVPDLWISRVLSESHPYTYTTDEDFINLTNKSIGYYKLDILETRKVDVQTTTTGSGNAITSVTSVGSTVTVTKGTTFAVNQDLTDHKNNHNNPHQVTKAQIGLNNVDNTSDLTKPISNATRTALNEMQSEYTDYIQGLRDSRDEHEESIQTNTEAINSHINNDQNPHLVTKAQVGLSNVDNTADEDKPISSPTREALDELRAEDSVIKDTINSLGTSLTNTLDSNVTNLNSSINNLARTVQANKDTIDAIEKIPEGGSPGDYITRDAAGKLTWTVLGNLPQMPSNNNLDEISYGISWKATWDEYPDPKCTRVGNLGMAKTLPIQSQIRGCIAQSTKTDNPIIYWLDPDDWRFKKNVLNSDYFHIVGDTSVTLTDNTSQWAQNDIEFFTDIPYEQDDAKVASLCNKLKWMWIKNTETNDKIQIQSASLSLKDDTYYIKIACKTDLTPNDDGTPNYLDGCTFMLGSCTNGYDGEVMLYFPEFYIRSWYKNHPDGRYTQLEVRISQVKVDDTWQHQPQILMGAYKDCLMRTAPANWGYLSGLPNNTYLSISNFDTNCRGTYTPPATNNLEDPAQNNLGKPALNTSIPTFRQAAHNVNKHVLSYNQYKNCIYWLYMTEYANFNSQLPYNPSLDTNGFHIGGLGNGITNATNQGANYSLCTNGYMNDLGNHTGVKKLNTAYTPVNNIYGNKWRGLENAFGDSFIFTDGVICKNSTIADRVRPTTGATYNCKEVWVCDNPHLFTSTESLINNRYYLAGYMQNTSQQYIWEFDNFTTNKAQIIPNSVGTSNVTGKCDWLYTATSGVGLYALCFGGSSALGAYAGFGGCASFVALSGGSADVSSRSVILLEDYIS